MGADPLDDACAHPPNPRAADRRCSPRPEHRRWCLSTAVRHGAARRARSRGRGARYFGGRHAGRRGIEGRAGAGERPGVVLPPQFYEGNRAGGEHRLDRRTPTASARFTSRSEALAVTKITGMLAIGPTPATAPRISKPDRIGSMIWVRTSCGAWRAIAAMASSPLSFLMISCSFRSRHEAMVSPAYPSGSANKICQNCTPRLSVIAWGCVA